MSGCRIGKIKLKAGGVIHRLPTVERDDFQKRFISAASAISSHYKPDEMCGYVVMAWDADGAYSLGFRIHDDSVVGPTMLPSYVADALRRDLINTGSWEN